MAYPRKTWSLLKTDSIEERKRRLCLVFGLWKTIIICLLKTSLNLIKAPPKHRNAGESVAAIKAIETIVQDPCNHEPHQDQSL